MTFAIAVAGGVASGLAVAWISHLILGRNATVIGGALVAASIAAATLAQNLS